MALVASDIAVGVTSCLAKYRDRAESCAATWLREFPCRLLFDARDDARLGAVRVTDRPEEYRSCVAKQLGGLPRLLAAFPAATWYLLADDDSYVHAGNLLAALQRVRPSRTPFLCGRQMQVHPRRYLPLAVPGELTYGCGGAGLLLSRTLVQRIVPSAPGWAALWLDQVRWERAAGHADVAMAWLVLAVAGGRATTLPGLCDFPMRGMRDRTPNVRPGRPPLSLHRISPDAMRGLWEAQCRSAWPWSPLVLPHRFTAAR